jgi:hypothetical protein
MFWKKRNDRKDCKDREIDEWKKDLEAAVKASSEVDHRMSKEIDSPCAYACPNSYLVEERKAWIKLKHIPRNLLSNREIKILESMLKYYT